MNGTRVLLVAAAAVAMGGGCGGDTAGPGGGTYPGPIVAVGAGRAWSWVVVDAAGKPLSLGVTLDDEAFEALPTSAVEYVLALPGQASPTAFDHIGLDWNPQGHDPSGVYDVPHFDVHFYSISAAQRDAITVAGDDTLRVFRQPDPQDIPAGYVDAHAAVPRMGNHWIDPAAPEFQPGGAFTMTFIYGFYDGQLVFWEPMIAVSYWSARPNESMALALPQRYPETGVCYPTRCSVRFEGLPSGPGIERHGSHYKVSLDDFVLR